jgi:hypothetical protein
MPLKSYARSCSHCRPASHKTFKITERFGFELRAKFFNITNNQNFDTPSPNKNVSTNNGTNFLDTTLQEDVAVEVEITCRVVRIAVRNKRAGGLKSALIKPCACNPPLKSCWLSITNMTKCIQWRLTPRSKGGFVPEPERLRGCRGRQG